jgi:hypothetical protein
MAGTREAIDAAWTFAQARDARVHVIAAKAMPAECSLDQQSALVHSFARTITKLAESLGGQIDVLPCVCRKLMDVMQLLPQGATVVIAGRSHRWWPTEEQRLALDLKAHGYRVVFIHVPDATA